ncbi:MAG: ATP-binding cassette domain-containing protein [Clostridia bacterium]
MNNLPAKIFVFQNENISVCFLNDTIRVCNTCSNSPNIINCNNNFVSENHGYFDKDEHGYYYIDEDSYYGSWYNDIKLTANQKQYLQNGDTIRILSDENDCDFVTIVFLTDYVKTYDWHAFEQLDQVYEIDIGHEECTINIESDLVLSNHATLVCNQDVWGITDHGSYIGVYVNNIKILNQTELSSGDCIRIANYILVFTGKSIIFQKYSELNSTLIEEQNRFQPLPHNVLSIRIKERSVVQNSKKIVLLQDLNMDIKNGELVLILGGSGAGKTTFMNAVMGYEKADGQIMYENTDIYEKFDEIKSKIGFVPQQDLLRGYDTVYDTICNAAHMKIPMDIKQNEKKSDNKFKKAIKNFSGEREINPSVSKIYNSVYNVTKIKTSADNNKEKRDQRIEKAIETLGLERERKSLVSKLSGGQRKRLSIAVEYIADPSLFFLDEPDSGLDGIMARTLMKNLRTIADEDKIVMVISHAPDRTSKLFDKVVVLAKSEVDNCGHLAFFGSVEETIEFFDTDCLEGVVQRINRTDEGGDGLADEYISKYKQLK